MVGSSKAAVGYTKASSLCNRFIAIVIEYVKCDIMLSTSISVAIEDGVDFGD